MSAVTDDVQFGYADAWTQMQKNKADSTKGYTPEHFTDLTMDTSGDNWKAIGRRLAAVHFRALNPLP